jgi:hypothetical protein
MATKFVKASVDDTIVLAPNQIFRRKFNLGTDWTRMRMIVWMSMTDVSGDDVTATTETFGNAAAIDRFALGIAKLSTSDLIPGQAGINFAGWHNHLAENCRFTAGSPSSITFADAATNGNGGVTIGTVRNTASSNSNVHPLQLPTAAQMAGSSTWCMPWGLDIEILDRGGATQQIKIYTTQSDLSVAVGAVSEAGVSASLAAMSPQATAFITANFHITGTPADIPDSVYIRSPFVNNSLRIHAYGVKRIT